MQRYMRGMTDGGLVVARGAEGLSDAAIAAAVPSVFAAGAHASRSDRYAHIPTGTVLAGLRREGFEPFLAQQSRTRIAGKAAFTKHLLRLRHRSRTGRGGEAHEIILVNAHDGTASYQMISGVFRFVCANGLFAGDAFGEVTVRHTGDAVHKVIEGAYTVLQDADTVMADVDAMKATPLAPPERDAFARAAHVLRFEDPAAAPVPAERLLAPRREADRGGDLWSVFNRVQENVLRGGQGGLVRDARGRRRRRSTRAITGIDQGRALNRALWTLAEEMRALRSA